MQKEKENKVFWDENKNIQFDFSNAADVFEPHELASMYPEYLSDVDFVIEDTGSLICLEYKNSNINNANKPEVFQEKLVNNQFWKKIAKKFYGTMFLVWACDKNKLEKPVQYILLMEANPGMDRALIKKLIAKMPKHLPFAYTNREEIKRCVINKEFLVLNLEEWKERFPQYPICK